jgi:hypothetical protein
MNQSINQSIAKSMFDQSDHNLQSFEKKGEKMRKKVMKNKEFSLFLTLANPATVRIDA